MKNRFRIKHKPSGKWFGPFDINNPPKIGIEHIYFTAAITKQDVVAKKPNVEMYVKFDDLEIEDCPE